MACMEHYCTKCGWADMNNNPLSPSSCPKCGSPLCHIFDEKNDYNEHKEERIKEDKNE